MRILKAVIAILIISLVVVGTIGCQRSNTTTTAATKQVKVSVGTISNAITGTASLGLAKTQDLVFETAGYVDQILVDESDSVTKGQVLATLDNSTWEATVKSLRQSLSSTQRSLNNKQYTLSVNQRLIDSKKLAKLQTELNLLSAQNTLDNLDDVKQAQASIDIINNDIAYAQSALRNTQAMGDTAMIQRWIDQIKYLNQTLETAQARLNKVLKGTGVSSDKVALQIIQSAFAVAQAQKAVLDAQTAIDDAQVTINNTLLDVKDAQQAVDDAQSKLDEQLALNLVITAPFDGFIPSIKVTGGAQVYKGTVAMVIADPNQFQATFMVSETDIFSVKVGQSATVSVDALSGQAFPAKITAIAPLATISSGVVNYKVTAELTSLIPISSSTTSAGGLAGVLGTGGNRTGFPSGVRPSNFPSGIPSGSARPSGFPTGALPSGFPSNLPSGLAGALDNFTAGGRRTTSASGTPVALKQGLSASVSITIQEKANVLIVPIRAVTTSGGKSTVQVVNGAATEAVTVTTGLSDSSNIEITSGLSDGQTVMVKASGTTSSSGFGPGGGGVIRIP
jgi:HlyD family secretion protein